MLERPHAFWEQRCLTKGALAGALLVSAVAWSAPARATGDVTPILYVYLAVNGGFEVYDVASAALEERNDIVLGTQLAVGALQSVPLTIWGSDSYGAGLVLMGALPMQLTAYPLLAWASRPRGYWQALGVSWEVGLNWAFTLTALGAGPNPKSASWFSVTEIALAVPQAVAAGFILSDFEANVPNVAGLANALWATALAVDGALRLGAKPRSAPPHARVLPELYLAADGPFPKQPAEQRCLFVARWPWP